MARKQQKLSRALKTKLKDTKVARLATLDTRRGPHIIPFCFAYDGKVFYTPIDRKPKRVAPQRLTRLQNIRKSPHVAILIDHYDEDWSRLWYILIRGTAKIVPPSARKEQRRAVRLLKAKYPQYAGGMLADDAMVIRITPQKVTSWGKIEQ
jgi:PPOX class probable F420-dependent enzyme